MAEYSSKDSWDDLFLSEPASDAFLTERAPQEQAERTFLDDAGQVGAQEIFLVTTTSQCPECAKNIVPQVIANNYGQPVRSVCPFCGVTIKEFMRGNRQMGWLDIVIGIAFFVVIIGICITLFTGGTIP